MAVYKYDDRIPVIGKNCYISDSARVIGDVTISDNCYVGPCPEKTQRFLDLRQTALCGPGKGIS